ncbi:glycosyl transferase family 90-domain-containing protein [Mycena latifolia]|nr:glycosyl transferase family 90-domain-containing protein [Mycena latifolia]
MLDPPEEKTYGTRLAGNELVARIFSCGRNLWRLRRRLSIAAGIISFVVFTLAIKSRFDRARRFDPATVAARLAVDALYARQSTSFSQASARYSLRTKRPPPPNYDHWYQFAQDRKCLVDEYDQIHRDFEPFYQFAEADPRYFQKMIDRADSKVFESSAVYNAILSLPQLQETPAEITFLSAYLPNMTFILNGRDEPRVAFNYRAPGALKHALSAPHDSTPFQIALPISFTLRAGAISRREQPLQYQLPSVLIASAKAGFTTDLYPMLSMAKISPCFSDILFPGEVNWRGMSTGGMIMGDNYHHFARFKLADLARDHPDLMDVAITRFAETLCEEGCNRTVVMEEYGITGDWEPREELYRFKYAIDVDGTTFSGRYLGLLRSGSLVFKATAFEEYFNDWLRPFEHYVPVKADLSNLADRIRWANVHPDEARLIQQRGLEFSRRVLTDDQNDCYFLAVLLEWARLQGYAQGS